MSDYKRVLFVASFFDDETGESVAFKKELLLNEDTTLKKLKDEAGRFGAWIEEQF